MEANKTIGPMSPTTIMPTSTTAPKAKSFHCVAVLTFFFHAREAQFW